MHRALGLQPGVVVVFEPMMAESQIGGQGDNGQSQQEHHPAHRPLRCSGSAGGAERGQPSCGTHG